MHYPKDLYINVFEMSNRVKISPREIDVLSCIMSGRASKGIASLLEISFNTVETHTRNIMRKLECNSREELVKRIESSDSHLFIKQHYISLQLRIAFEQSLNEISKMLVEPTSHCLIVNWQEQNDDQALLKQIRDHLALAGIKASLETRKEIDPYSGSFFENPRSHCIIYSLNSQIIKALFSLRNYEQPLKNIFFLLYGEEHREIQNIPGIKCFDFSNEEYYYFSVFEILKTLISNLNFEHIILDFQNRFNALQKPNKLSAAVLSRLPAIEANTPAGEVGTTTTTSQMLTHSSASIFTSTTNTAQTGTSEPEAIIVRDGARAPSSAASNLENSYASLAMQHSGEENKALSQHFATLANEKFQMVEDAKLAERVQNESFNEKKPANRTFYQVHGRYFLTAGTFALLLVIGSLFFYWVKQNNNIANIQSELVIPRKDILINRSELINQINHAFKRQADIQTLALIGIGGAGKTTAARQYARQQQAKFIWEIHAESGESLKESFRNLAQVLAITESDKKALNVIQNNKESKNYEEKIMLLVKEKLRSLSNWLLIYDNVETFKDIENYLPINPQTWGKGRVILTTRDSNIGNNQYIQHVLPIKELDAHQKFNLFMKIMAHKNENAYTADQVKEIQIFLEKIPPFPLDISIAACYLRSTDISPSAYLEILSQSNQEFINMQENILRELGEYTKTRYSIITLSLQDIILKQKDFQDLFLLIALINSQNIPRYLLNNFKNAVIVDNFLLNLKRHSFIINSSPPFSSAVSTVSIHRDIQETIRSYFIERLDVKNRKEHLQSITENLENNINEAIRHINLKQMRELVSHCETFLSHTGLITNEMEGIIKGGLGIINYYYGDNQKAKQHLVEAMRKINHNPNSKRIAFFTGYLGNVYRDLGDYRKGRDLLIKSLEYYEKSYPKDSLRYAWFLAYLGVIERYLGNYQTAIKLFEKGLTVHNGQCTEDKNYVDWVSGQLGILTDKLGHHEKAKLILERILANFRKARPDDHFDIAWALEHLGPVYIKLGDYKKAKNALEKSLNIYQAYFPDELGARWIKSHLNNDNTFTQSKELFKKINKIYDTHFHENYIYAAWPMNVLANLYVALGEYERAKLLLEQCLYIYQKNYGNQHLTSAEIFNDLGRIYLFEEDLDVSKRFVEKALTIYQHEKHSDRYKSLEMLSEIFLKKATLSERKGEYRQAAHFKSQAFDYLKKALEVIEVTLPKDYPDRIKIELKLKNMQRTSSH